MTLALLNKHFGKEVVYLALLENFKNQIEVALNSRMTPHFRKVIKNYMKPNLNLDAP